jgi:hypothetical protein
MKSLLTAADGTSPADLHPEVPHAQR